MTMKALNTVSLTLMIALIAVVPGTLLGKHLPGLFAPSLQSVAIAAWLSGLMCWFVAREMNKKEKSPEAKPVKSHAVRTSMILLLVVTAGVAGFHFFGDKLMG